MAGYSKELIVGAYMDKFIKCGFIDIDSLVVLEDNANKLYTIRQVRMNSVNTPMLPPIELNNTGLVYRFRYSDGHTVLRTFQTEKECGWFAYNEGDHLMEVEQVKF